MSRNFYRNIEMKKIICYNYFIIYTYRNEEENKDVYMVALRDDDGSLIGYYEKHEYRNKETVGLYQQKK